MAAKQTAKGMGLKQLVQKKYKMLEGLSEEMRRSFGDLTEQILMIIYGPSGSGKSRLTMNIVKELMKYGDVLYNAQEEGYRRTMQRNVMDNLNVDEHSGKIQFFDHTLTYDLLVEKLKKKKSPKFIIIDSLQYWHIDYEQYKRLKESFPSKGFIFISHAVGKRPKGQLAIDIEYDVDIKCRVEGFVAMLAPSISRYGGNQPYVIYEEGAKKYWKKKYKSIIK